MNQTFSVQGMTCGHCEKAVTQAVQSVDPQAQVTIDRPAGKVEVQVTPSKIMVGVQGWIFHPPRVLPYQSVQSLAW